MDKESDAQRRATGLGFYIREYSLLQASDAPGGLTHWRYPLQGGKLCIGCVPPVIRIYWGLFLVRDPP